MSARSLPAVLAFPASALAGMRPRQWTKNLVLFAGLLFAKKTGDLESWAEAFTVFGAYCAASSAAYLMNDVLDAEHDRRHPTKRFRPVASGRLAPRDALLVAGLLAALAFATAAALGDETLALLACFAGLQAAYSLRLKRVAFIDVLTIAGLFVLRAAAGAAAIDVHISLWLLVCTGLLALFLGLAKRRSELVLISGDPTSGRAVLGKYSVDVVERLVRLAAAGAVIAYLLYALTARDSQVMLVTVPLVVAGLLRYLYLIHRHDLGEEPEQVLLTDRITLACVGCWTLSALLALMST